MTEVSVDTNISRRRNLTSYQRVRQDGVELMVSPDLARYSRNLTVDLKEFLFFRNLKAVAELSNGALLGSPGH